MGMHSEALADQAELRRQLVAMGSQHQALLRAGPLRPLLDIALDWGLILAGTSLVHAAGAAWVLPVLLLIGNRQRALGNILHDAGHGNLDRDRRINDTIARLLLAPALFANLARYRELHLQHHRWLGRAGLDPDLIDIPAAWPAHWLGRVRACAGSGAAWWGSFAGHLGAKGTSMPARLGILAWWAVMLGMLAAVAGPTFVGVFAALWLLARATSFHLITTVREMCDHHGLQPGGVFSFTRDLIGRSLWRSLIHPRHNGYHLTHHLLPAVPYHRLPQAQRLLQQLPLYRERSRVCTAYVAGEAAVANAWQCGSR